MGAWFTYVPIASLAVRPGVAGYFQENHARLVGHTIGIGNRYVTVPHDAKTRTQPTLGDITQLGFLLFLDITFAGWQKWQNLIHKLPQFLRCEEDYRIPNWGHLFEIELITILIQVGVLFPVGTLLVCGKISARCVDLLSTGKIYGNIYWKKTIHHV
jgi:hypothetical protein